MEHSLRRRGVALHQSPSVCIRPLGSQESVLPGSGCMLHDMQPPFPKLLALYPRAVAKALIDSVQAITTYTGDKAWPGCLQLCDVQGSPKASLAGLSLSNTIHPMNPQP